MENRKKEILEELEAGSFLQKMKGRKEGYSVPMGYFRQLQDNILAELDPVKPLSWWERFRQSWNQTQAAVALAGLALLLIAGWFLLRPTENTAQAGQLTQEEINRYIQANIHEFDLELLVRYTQDETIKFDLLQGSDFESDEFDAYLDQILDDIDMQTLEEIL